MRIGLITIGALSALVTCSGISQTQSGVTPPTPPTAPSGPMPQVLQRGQMLPPGLQRGQTLPQGLQRQQLPPGMQNQNQLPSGSGATNMVPNAGTFSNQTTAVTQDQAVTPADQALLIRVQQTVQARFQAASPWTPVHFNVDNGVVTLVGSVPNAQVEEQLEGLVQQVPGVTGLVDQLQVRAANSAPQVTSTVDQGLLLRIRQTVLPQIEVGGNPVPINFSAQQGIVTITGTLPSVAEQREVSALVQQVPGVVQVNNQIRVGSAVGTLTPNTPTVGSGAVGPMPNNNLGTRFNQPGNPGFNNNLTPTGRTNGVSLAPGLQNQNPQAPAFNQTNAVPRMSQ